MSEPRNCAYCGDSVSSDSGEAYVYCSGCRAHLEAGGFLDSEDDDSDNEEERECELCGRTFSAESDNPYDNACQDCVD